MQETGSFSKPEVKFYIALDKKCSNQTKNFYTWSINMVALFSSEHTLLKIVGYKIHTL